MKQRIISAAIGLLVLVVALGLYDTLVVNCLAAFICGVAVLELLNAAGLTKYKLLSAVSILFSGLLMFINAGNMMAYMSVFSTAYAVFCFCYLLYRHNDINIKEICYCLLITLLVTLSFYMLISIRDRSSAQVGMFYLLMAFGSAWWSDTGAYFAGTFFGKHK
ncbi:MAG: phosphatidate cytidylyltransferase, partial [Angelakisella sp.]